MAPHPYALVLRQLADTVRRRTLRERAARTVTVHALWPLASSLSTERPLKREDGSTS
jgi:hypothetical protein